MNFAYIAQTLLQLHIESLNGSYLSSDFVIMTFGLFGVVINFLWIHKTLCEVRAILEIICATVPGEWNGCVCFATQILGVISARAIFVIA